RSGLESQGVGRLVGTGDAAPCSAAPVPEARVVADGVCNLPCRRDRDALPDHTDGTTVDLSVAVVDPVARRVPPVGGPGARLLVAVGARGVEGGVRMPRSVWAFQPGEEVGDGEGDWGGSNRGQHLRIVEGTC